MTTNSQILAKIKFSQTFLNIKVSTLIASGCPCTTTGAEDFTLIFCCSPGRKEKDLYVPVPEVVRFFVLISGGYNYVVDKC